MHRGKFLAVALAAIFSARCFAATYAITDLGAGTATAINNANQVVGTTTAGVPYIYASGSTTALPLPSGAAYMAVTGVNALGQISGTATISSGVYHAVIYANGAWTDLYNQTYGASLHPGAAIGVSDTSVVLGSNNPYGDGGAFVSSGGIAAPVGPNGFTAAAINPAGTTVVGYTGGSPGRSQLYNDQAVVVTGGVATTLTGGVAGITGVSVQATGVNAKGDVIGYHNGTTFETTIPFKLLPQGFLYANGTYTALNPGGDASTLSTGVSMPSGINASDQIVGIGGVYTYNQGFGGASSAFGITPNLFAALWQNSASIDLNTTIPTGTGWNLINANAINDDGDIVGSGTLNGVTHSFLLTPTPEPTGICVLALGGLTFVTRRRRT